jgi:DNA-binding transcriptional ArsR family regulator
MTSLLQLVSDPTRQRILEMIWEEELSAGDIARSLPVTFGAVSQHLGLLRDAGAVRVRRDGKFRYYQADVEALGPVGEMLHAMWGTHLKRLKTLAELEQHRPRRKSSSTPGRGRRRR